ncbi:probable D-lactate dehydrogenase (cytochrome) [Fusarium fujikuroi IMI 58289]|uniref:D-lactate dehydrogenase (cytochrome) n=1 Tax=Gibberella fujikuroi (strain CBS 195.34 / IMI 58289 / NRRL A-6831) TaxID=1279085 RepID=S0EPF5_GIBF5|nr:probable D-lactate dehydrogenase (cytochrome) [Fusarium fujikuroi IMI 58289]KLP13306.1 putative D-lactate dehydrogenase (cytochrome) [Fusarium fujikuroi]CCT75028.1 probable D-lactate dehydrogenase (cytochrome) [Fusarium fujikuroi IMI 58289]SCO03798.1 probable D-lactate dehydrogenase (cytochrome) [Fusarium fujikuroi]
MLKTPHRALLECLRRPPSQCVVGLTVNRAFPTARRFSDGKSEHNGKSRTQEKRKRPIFLASALSATVTTIGGTLLYTVVSHEKQKDDESHYASRAEMELAVEEIRKALGEDAVSIEDEILHSHGYSDWSTINIERLPVAVAFPKTTEEVAAIAKICHKRRVPMIPYSGGSSVEGHFSAPFGGVSVDFVNMNQILEVHSDDLNVVVQPSVPWMDLNEKIKDTGLFFPIDPGPSAQIGGMVGTNCSGTNAVKYGTMRDWVVNLTVVLSDGTILKTRRRPRKSSAGYNLNSLFVGSEGTLGFVTEATLKLAPIPEHTGIAVVTFPSVKAAATMAIEVIRRGIPISAVEILDEVLMSVINRMGATSRKWKEEPTLFFKFSGSDAVVKDSITQVQSISQKHHANGFQYESDPEKQKALWSARKEALWSMMALRETDGHVWSTDVAVPLSRVSELIDISKKELVELGLFGSILGHIGDGNFHETILFEEKQRKEVEDCVHKMVSRAIEMEGTCTGEHGVGLGKKEFLREEVGEVPIQVMRAIKTSLDPLWLMNPGKIFDRRD